MALEFELWVSLPGTHMHSFHCPDHQKTCMGAEWNFFFFFAVAPLLIPVTNDSPQLLLTFEIVLLPSACPVLTGSSCPVSPLSPP